MRAAGLRYFGFAQMFADRRDAAAAREGRIELGEIGQLDAKSAEADGEAGRCIFREHDIGAGIVQACEKTRRPDLVQEFDRRQIQRHLQACRAVTVPSKPRSKFSGA